MTFAIPGEAYDRYMGRYSAELAVPFADFAGIASGMRVLDVGCGTGVLTVELARRLGDQQVAAVDPAAGFLESCRSKLPLVDVRLAPAEALPWGDDEFDSAVSQLAVSFMTDAPRALREMRRVVRQGGNLAACMWESGASMQVVDLFWRAYAVLKPDQVINEPPLPYRTEAALRSLWETGGLSRVELTSLHVASEYANFEDFWSSMLGAAGPVGAQLAKMGEPELGALREECWRLLDRPTAAFSLTARAWAVRGIDSE